MTNSLPTFDSLRAINLHLAKKLKVLFFMIKQVTSIYLFGFIVIFLMGFSPVTFSQNLLEIYEFALENDPVLKQSHASQNAVGESKKQSIANFLPNVSAVGFRNGTRLFNDTNNYQGLGLQTYTDYNIVVNLTQPIFHWEHWIQLSQADNQIAQAEADYQAELQKLMVKVTEAYFNVLSAEDNLEFSHSEKKAIARQLEQAKQRFEVGFINISESHQTQAAFDRAIATEIQAANDLDNQKEALTAIIGEKNFTLNNLRESIPLVKLEPDNITAWSDVAEVANFSVISAFNQMEYSRKTIDIQRNGYLPKLDLVGTWGNYTTDYTYGMKGDMEIVGLRLNVPIYEGGATTSKVSQACYKFEQAKENLIAVKRAVKHQVKNAYRGIITSISKVAALKVAVSSAEVALQSTQAGFDVGLETLVNVLNQQKNLYRDKRDYSRTRYDYLLNSIKLKQAASTLVQEDLEQINQLLVAGSASRKSALFP
jgi:outer membrane protein